MMMTSGSSKSTMLPSHMVTTWTVSSRISPASLSPAAYARPTISLVTASALPPASSSMADLRPLAVASLVRAFFAMAVPEASASMHPFLPHPQTGPW